MSWHIWHDLRHHQVGPFRYRIMDPQGCGFRMEKSLKYRWHLKELKWAVYDGICLQWPFKSLLSSREGALTEQRLRGSETLAASHPTNWMALYGRDANRHLRSIQCLPEWGSWRKNVKNSLRRTKWVQLKLIFECTTFLCASWYR